MMERSKHNRNSFGYKWRMFWFQLTWQDIVDTFWKIWEDLASAAGMIILLGILFLVPHLFH